MRYFIALITLALTLAACGNNGPIDFYDLNDNPSLTLCSPNQVEVMKVEATAGSGHIRVPSVYYRDQGIAFSSPVEYWISAGESVNVPFCKYQNVGDIVFDVEVQTTRGNSITLWFTAPGEHADMVVWDTNGYSDFRSWSIGVEAGSDGREVDQFNVAIEWWTY